MAAVPVSTAESFERAKSYMKRVNGQGLALYDHIASVILKIVHDKPGDPVGQFEDISVAVKEASLQSEAVRDAIPIPEDQESKVKREPPCVQPHCLRQPHMPLTLTLGLR